MFKKVVLPFLGVYSLTSYYFLKNPTQLHPKHQFSHELFNSLTANPGKKVLSISHRGGSFEKVENTIEAFQNSIENGVDLLEMDLQLTKDGKVVVCHDESLRRLCGVDVKVSELNYDELPKFSEKISLDHFNNTILDTSKLQVGKIPTLEEVFQKFPNTLMQLDLKGGSEEVTRKTNDLVKLYKRENITFWGAMGDDQHLRRYNQDLPRFFSPFAVIKVYGLYVTGLLPFFNLTSSVFSIPKYSQHYEKWKESKKAPAVGIYFTIFKGLESISKPLIRHLQDRGILVFHWVLNEEEDFEASLKFDVDGIMTDKPTLLHDFLKKHNKKV